MKPALTMLGNTRTARAFWPSSRADVLLAYKLFSALAASRSNSCLLAARAGCAAITAAATAAQRKIDTRQVLDHFAMFPSPFPVSSGRFVHGLMHELGTHDNRAVQLVWQGRCVGLRSRVAASCGAVQGWGIG